MGNLNSDNNVAGIQWFLDAVVPLIQMQKADVSILIAGSKPVPMIRDLCEQVACVDLKINPRSAIEIYASGRVLVNPIAMGGGVSIKSIDMLTLGKPIVSLAKGIAGLPESVKPLFRLATDAPSFAEAVMICLSEASLASAEMSQVSSEPISRVLSPVERQSLIEDAFGLPKIQQLIDQLQMLLVSQKI
ncbi:MAG: glycosyltransferase [Synechococcales cyanobacterium CRU_2_2]|nr:glycosyltransferase [Synechococcales cyanobacterium CRU_2_2]